MAENPMLNKTGYGEKAKIEEAKAAGKINEGDFVVTDTDEFAFINPSGETRFLKSKSSKRNRFRSFKKWSNNSKRN